MRVLSTSCDKRAVLTAHTMRASPGFLVQLCCFVLVALLAVYVAWLRE